MLILIILLVNVWVRNKLNLRWIGWVASYFLHLITIGDWEDGLANICLPSFLRTSICSSIDKEVAALLSGRRKYLECIWIWALLKDLTESHSQWWVPFLNSLHRISKIRTSISSQLRDKSSDAMNILFVTPQMLVRGSRNQTESPEEACDLWKAALSNSSNLEMQLVHGAPARAVTTYPFLVTRFIKWVSLSFPLSVWFKYMVYLLDMELYADFVHFISRLQYLVS